MRLIDADKIPKHEPAAIAAPELPGIVGAHAQVGRGQPREFQGGRAHRT